MDASSVWTWSGLRWVSKLQVVTGDSFLKWLVFRPTDASKKSSPPT